MEWEELVGTRAGTKMEPTVSEVFDGSIALLLEEYVAVERQAKALSERTKMLREQITAAFPLQDGDEVIVATHKGDVLLEGRSSFTCSPVKMREIVARKYADANVPDFVSTKYSVTRKAFELLDTETRDYFYDAVTYKTSNHKITGSY